MTWRKVMTMLCSFLTVCSVSAQDSRPKEADRQAVIYRLPLFERAVRCTKYFEGWHSENTIRMWDMGTSSCRVKSFRHAP